MSDPSYARLVSDIGSANRASDALIKRGGNIDSLLLNAGIVPGDQMHKTGDDIEMAFASSIIGHHIIANRLLEANIVAEGGRIVIAGSEAARNDLPAAMGMELYDFAVAPVSGAGTNLHDALTAFARGTGAATFAPKFNGFRYYAVTKLFTTWWAARMAEKYADRVSVFAVSPGSTMNTNVGRNIKGLQKFIFTKVMPVIGPALGMHQPAKKGAKRYLDVLNATNGQFKSGRTYTSRRKKLVGPMEEQTYPHMLDIERQNIAWTVLGELTGNVDSTANAA